MQRCIPYTADFCQDEREAWARVASASAILMWGRVVGPFIAFSARPRYLGKSTTLDRDRSKVMLTTRERLGHRLPAKPER